MRDDKGIVQLWTVPPNGGPFSQITRSHENIFSAFTWSPDGSHIACVIGHRVCIVEAVSGRITPLSEPCCPEEAPRPEACVFSPDGLHLAFVRQCGTTLRVVNRDAERRATLQNQLFVCDVPS